MVDITVSVAGDGVIDDVVTDGNGVVVVCVVRGACVVVYVMTGG